MDTEKIIDNGVEVNKDNISNSTQEGGQHNIENDGKHSEHKHHKEHDSKEVEKLKKEIEELKKLNECLDVDKASLKDAYARKVAEFDNYKKRVIKDMDAMKFNANKELITEIIPIFDNFSRAIDNSSKNNDFNTLFEGLKIVYSQIGNVFEKWGVKPIESLGKQFDHNFHEALMMEERDDVEFETTVTEEIERGYTLGENVLKHSKVKVAKKKI